MNKLADVQIFLGTSSGTHMFNNHYYRNIVRADRYFFNDDKCTKVTDAGYNKPKTRWVAAVRRWVIFKNS